MKPDIEITDDDRARFAHYPDAAIRGIKIIESTTTADLLAALDDDDKLKDLSNTVGAETNPHWTLMRVADVLYNRGEIDAASYKMHTNRH